MSAKFAHQHRKEPARGDSVAHHAEYHILRAIAFFRGWLDRDLWTEPEGRRRADLLLTALAELEVARLWVGIRDVESAQDVADWMQWLEDPDFYLEWLGMQAEAIGVDWDDVLPYGGDNR